MAADRVGAGEAPPAGARRAAPIAAAAAATAKTRSERAEAEPGPSGAVGRERIAPLDLSGAEALAREQLADLAGRDIDLFVLRLRRYWPDLVDGLVTPYGEGNGRLAILRDILPRLADAYRARPEGLKLLDLARGLAPDWFQEPTMIGYVCYVDRFAGTLRGVEEHLDHLEGLGIGYLHLMALLEPRPGDSDGGYAVANYRAVDPRLGTMDDLEHLCERLHERGISVCIDFVLNHAAAEHDWARRAAGGDPEASSRFWIFPDRTMPDRYEATLPEVFPDFAPGNFSQLPDGRWVWTTFNTFQWDLNWSNPIVFADMLDTMLWLANRGVDVFRLDAVAFIWKRLGSDCQNQPEVHDLVTALRACARIVAPAVVFKAEAIVGKDQLAPYLGIGRRSGRECDLAYQNSLMVQFWSALATRETRLMTLALADFPAKPGTAAWATYIRCHDDIGWAIANEDAAAVGWDGWSHRAFLSEFYAGEFPGSFARGERFQVNPINGDSRISGTFASLAGVEAALADGDPVALGLAIERILLGHALIFAWDGLPLLYMGDEIGLLNDRSYLSDPVRAPDNRWLHRPPMAWSAASAWTDRNSPSGRILSGIRDLIRARRRSIQLHASAPLDILDLASDGIFAFVRRHPVGPLLAVHNLTDRPMSIEPAVVPLIGPGSIIDAISGVVVDLTEAIDLPPYAVRWWTPRSTVLR
ncbi:MAG: alpha-amylase family protein [Candidatus Limnocylindrales bacterium]